MSVYFAEYCIHSSSVFSIQKWSSIVLATLTKRRNCSKLLPPPGGEQNRRIIYFIQNDQEIFWLVFRASRWNNKNQIAAGTCLLVSIGSKLKRVSELGMNNRGHLSLVRAQRLTTSSQKEQNHRCWKLQSSLIVFPIAAGPGILCDVWNCSFFQQTRWRTVISQSTFLEKEKLKIWECVGAAFRGEMWGLERWLSG